MAWNRTRQKPFKPFCLWSRFFSCLDSLPCRLLLFVFVSPSTTDIITDYRPMSIDGPVYSYGIKEIVGAVYCKSLRGGELGRGKYFWEWRGMVGKKSNWTRKFLDYWQNPRTKPYKNRGLRKFEICKIKKPLIRQAGSAEAFVGYLPRAGN